MPRLFVFLALVAAAAVLTGCHHHHAHHAHSSHQPAPKHARAHVAPQPTSAPRASKALPPPKTNANYHPASRAPQPPQRNVPPHK